MTSYCGAFQFTLMQMAGCNPSINPETGKGSFLFIHSVPSSIRQRQCRLGCSYRSLIHPGNNNTQANAVTLYAAPMRNPDAGNRTQAWTALTQRGCLPLCPRGRSNTMIVQQIPNKPRRKREKMREKEHTPSAVYTRRRRSPRSSRERCKLQLLSLQLTRRRRKAMPDSTADNAPPLALILVKRLAQASDLPPTKSISPMLPHPFLPSMQASQGKREREKPTSSSVHAPPFAFSFVQYRTCSVPLLLPGKNSAICFHVISCCSFSSDSSASSSSVNLALGSECGRGWGADEGCCGW